MELFYEVKCSSNPQNVNSYDHFLLERILPDRRPLCSLSCRNVIAFTTFNELTPNANTTTNSHKNNTNANGHSGHHNESSSAGGGGSFYVYVTDLNTPWENYLIKQSSNYVSHLKWDHSGSKLVIGTEDGQVEVHSLSPSENLFNSWQLCYSGYFPGEPILNTAWLNIPRIITIQPEKLDGNGNNFLYSEKFSTSVQQTKGSFGGKGLDGIICVTATGLLGAIINSNFTENGGKAISILEKINKATRNRIVTADFAYTKESEIMIASCGEKTKHPIHLCRVHIDSYFGIGNNNQNQSAHNNNNNNGEISINASQSLFLPYVSGAGEYLITAVRFTSEINPTSLLVSLKDDESGASILYLFELVQQALVLKPRFTMSTAKSEHNNFRWQQVAQLQFPVPIDEISMVPYPILSSQSLQNMSTLSPSISPSFQLFQNPLFQPVVAIALKSGIIHLLKSENLQQVATVNGGIKMEKDELMPSEPKQMKLNLNGGGGGNKSTRISSIQLSWSGTVMVTLDIQNKLSIYKLGTNLDTATSTTLLELSMLGGFDCWDIMMNIRSSTIESVIERMTESFSKQPLPVQSHYNVRLIVLKASLYRTQVNGHLKANDQQILLILHLIHGAMKGLLRPSDLSAHSKGPAESLSTLLASKSENGMSDLDKILLMMEAKEYTVESSTLQSLQPFFQWCADLTLQILASLPDNIKHSNSSSRVPGWEVCRDPKAISTLREIIVLMRIWGLISPSCLPSFRKTENLDVLPLLFRLLTKLASISLLEPDETLIDECCLLPSALQIPNIINFFSPNIINGNLITGGILTNFINSKLITKMYPVLKFEYGINPNLTNLLSGRNNEDLINLYQNQNINNGNWVDGLRLLLLGKSPVNGIKVCNRCGCSTMIQITTRSSSVANRSWDNRWQRNCPCGGFWKIPSSYLPQINFNKSYLNNINDITEVFLNF